MKQLLFILFAVPIFMSFRMQHNTNEIINALKSANANELTKYLDNFIDLKLPEKEEIKNMGKNQSGIAIQNFFKENGIAGFDLSSYREMGSSMYIAGKLLNGGKGFNVTIFFNIKDNVPQIITLRIN